MAFRAMALVAFLAGGMDLAAQPVGTQQVDSPGLGGIIGRVVQEETGQPVGEVMVWATPHGRGTAIGQMTENDGKFQFSEVPAGSYCLAVGAGQSYRPAWMTELAVAAGGVTEANLKVRRSVMIEGDSWVQPYPSFSQSFHASGLGVVMVGLKAFGPARRVCVQVREGDGPFAVAVGPQRVTGAVGGEATAQLWWSGAEVATRPGATYTISMSAESGQKWVSGVAGRGDVYGLGQAYFGASPRPASDLGVVLCEDNDGARTNYAMGSGDHRYRAVSAGQTFRALSRNVTFASAVLWGTGGGPPAYVRFSIHEDGPGGAQVGPSKNVAAVPEAAVGWGSEEVPITPGRTYYLHIESLGGAVFLASVAPDAYSQGSAVFDGQPAGQYDLAGMVQGEVTQEDFARLVAHPRAAECLALSNPSFENGLDGWSRQQGEAGAVVGCDGGVAPMWGRRMFGWTSKGQGEGSRPTIYQRVAARPGQWYSFSGSVYTDHVGGRSSDVKVRLVVDPTGGTDLCDYDKIESSQWYATEGQWRRGSVEFTAAAETITVGFELEQRFNLECSSLYVDGAHLERIEPQADKARSGK